MTLALVLVLAAAALTATGVVELAAAAAEAPAGAVPATLLRALARVGRRLGVASPPGDLGARIDAAGAPLGLGVGDVMAVKSGATLVGLAAALGLGTTLPGRLGLVAAIALPAAGFLAPDGWLRARARARGRAMELELPDVLDLLAVSLQAGLPVARALAEVARRHRGSLAREWGVAAAEIELGVPREHALARLARRCPAPGMPALVAALARAARHGAPLADTLGAHAREARAARARRVREDAARAAPKIQLVIALGLVPSVLLLVAAALLATLAH